MRHTKIAIAVASPAACKPSVVNETPRMAGPAAAESPVTAEPIKDPISTSGSAEGGTLAYSPPDCSIDINVL